VKPPINYNVIAGHSLERLSALSDGIFAVAMTLLVLDLRVPVLEVLHSQQPLWMPGAIQSEQALWDLLVMLMPRLLTYFMSFLTLGIFWIGHQTQVSQFTRSNRALAWIHLIFLFAVSLMPFSTGLLADYITYRLALVIYWLNILLMGVMLLISIRYAARAGLLSAENATEILAVSARRITVYQVLYALGAVLCIFNTYVSIAFIILVQLNAVIVPHIGPLDRF
jgi:uncharacterized membrane protein